MDSLGIYRMSGKVEEITLVKESFNSGHDPKLSNFQDINAVTGALKSFLRSLPTPLIHGVCYTNLMDEVKSSENINNTIQYNWDSLNGCPGLRNL